MEKCNYIVKIIVTGDTGVGKTSVLNSYYDGTFTDNYNATIGVDFKIKTVNLNNYAIKLHLWDVSGSKNFDSTVHSYCKNFSAIMLVFDLTSEASLLNLKSWFEIFKTNFDFPEKPQIILVGNKFDFCNDLNLDKIEKIIEPFEADYVFVSARTSINIKNAFNSIIKRVITSQNQNKSKIISLEKAQSQKCCSKCF